MSKDKTIDFDGDSLYLSNVPEKYKKMAEKFIMENEDFITTIIRDNVILLVPDDKAELALEWVEKNFGSGKKFKRTYEGMYG